MLPSQRRLAQKDQHPPLLYYTERLADQLFYQLQPLESGAIAVTTFADVQLMAPDTQSSFQLQCVFAAARKYADCRDSAGLSSQ